MSDEIALILVLVGLHLMESCTIVPHGTVVFRTKWWVRHTATCAGALLRVSRGRFVFLNPLDPRARVTVTGLPHIQPTADGVLDAAPEEDNALRRRPFVPWSAIGPTRAAGSSVACEGLGVLDCGSAATARVWARVLNTLRLATPARRAMLADRWLRIRFSPTIARRRQERVDRACRTLEVVATVAFLVLAAGAVLVTRRVSTPILLAFLGTGVFSGLALAILYWRAHARLEPRDWTTRLGRALMIAACFPVAFRARASLGRDALALVHPAAVAAALLPQGRARGFLAATLRRWTHLAAPPDAGSRDEATLRPAAAAISTQVEAIARASGIDPAALVDSPRLGDTSIRSWCPRCLATYVHASGVCAECPGVPLEPARR